MDLINIFLCPVAVMSSVRESSDAYVYDNTYSKGSRGMKEAKDKLRRSQSLNTNAALWRWRAVKTECESPEVKMTTVVASAPHFPASTAATSEHAELADYWAEYKDLYQGLHNHQRELYDDSHYEEGEQETEWLQAAGLAVLAVPFASGREVSEAELGEALQPLAREQAAAVRRRVRNLNRTVRRQRAARRARKPDIRDVFRDLENSSGSEPRSRSATPDSLDSLPSGGSGSPPAEWSDAPSPHNFADLFAPVAVGGHAPLVRTPSAPAAATTVLRRPTTRLSPSSPQSHSPPLPMHELFKHSDLHWADIASNTEGIELLGYQRFGTVQGPRVGKERINGSILKENDTFVNKHAVVSRARSAVTGTHQPLSFEHKFKIDQHIQPLHEDWPEKDSAVHIDSLTESQLKKLTPLLWLDLTALFDRHSLPLQKRKPSKKKRKEENNVFGVSLVTLLRKDMLLWEETWSLVPRAVRCMTDALRARTREEGILRIPGNKQKIEALCSLIERQFYEERELVEEAVSRAACHDIAAVFKRFLRDLPQPILTTELMHLFYQTYVLSGAAQGRALNLLVLLLPPEHRALLFDMLQLMNQIVAHQDTSKMTEHNVAMIIAPTLFPPSSLIKPSDSLEVQVATAANSCRVTEALMRLCDRLWLVPHSLHDAAQRKPQPNRRNHHT